MTRATKTINPLHFEDLEPHRFEDLIRQLIYDFRDWRALEATGRAGSDEGFDVRGWETLPSVPASEDEDEEEAITAEDKIWLVQCKREKSITPKKITKYLDEITAQKKEPLYGIVFVAPCDFSKTTRDIFIQTVREHGVREFRLWGKAELEDMLFQPKNDHLLFAYFGISLTIRRRSLKTQIRSRLTIKRKAIRCLGGVKGHNYQLALLRDPTESRYPYKKTISDFDKYPRWKLYYFLGHHHDGLEFLTRKHMAYLADDRAHWDYVERVDDSRAHHDPWASKTESKHLDKHAVWHFWNGIPEQNRAWLEIKRVVPYDKILDIDDEGDIYVSEPHIYVPFDRKHGPFEPYVYVSLSTVEYAPVEIYPEEENRIEFFPDEFPDPNTSKSETAAKQRT